MPNILLNGAIEPMRTDGDGDGGGDAGGGDDEGADDGGENDRSA